MRRDRTDILVDALAFICGVILGAMIFASVACGRGGQCRPPQRAMQETSPTTTCQEPRK